MDIFINKGIQNRVLQLKVCLGSFLFVWSVIESIRNENTGRRIWNDPIFSIFMCMGNLLLLSWMWGLSMYVWKECRIDYIRLLQLESFSFFTESSFTHSVSSSLASSSSSLLPYQIIFDHTSTLSNIYFIFFILYARSIRSANRKQGSLTYAHTLPMILIVIFGYYMFTPWKSKNQWLKLLFKVLLAPCHSIDFRDGYIGDILTSLVRVFIPLASSLLYLIMCLYSYLFNDFYYLSSPTRTPWWEKTQFFQFYLIPFLTLYPLWIRFMQCCRRSIETGDNWPHHMNALKYASAMSVIAVGSFQPIIRKNSFWIGALIGATIYQLIWDLTMDWGLISWYSGNTSNSNSKYPYRYNNHRHATRMKNSSIRITTTATTTSCTDDDDDDDDDHNSTFNRALNFFHLKLRSARLLHKRSRIYIAVIIFNTILRFAWTLTLLTYMYDTTNTTGSSNNHGTDKSSNNALSSSQTNSVKQSTIINSNNNINLFNNNNADSYNQPDGSSSLPLPLLLHDSLLTVMMSHSGPVVASAEIVRRMIWGWLRLEWEHIEVLGQPCHTVAYTINSGSDDVTDAAASVVDISKVKELEMVSLTNNNDNTNNTSCSSVNISADSVLSSSSSSSHSLDATSIAALSKGSVFENATNRNEDEGVDSIQLLLSSSSSSQSQSHHLQSPSSSSSSSSVSCTRRMMDLADKELGPLEKMSTDTWTYISSSSSLSPPSSSSSSSSSSFYSFSSIAIHTLWSDALVMLPLSNSLVQFSAQYLQLNITASHRTKARFLESCFFIMIMLFILFIASHISFQ